MLERFLVRVLACVGRLAVARMCARECLYIRNLIEIYWRQFGDTAFRVQIGANDKNEGGNLYELKVVVLMR